jgi:hypothetical protein
MREVLRDELTECGVPSSRMSSFERRDVRRGCSRPQEGTGNIHVKIAKVQVVEPENVDIDEDKFQVNLFENDEMLYKPFRVKC